MSRGRAAGDRARSPTSLDGASALANGASQWITGDPARADVQRLRARAPVPCSTGIGTVLARRSALNVRDRDAIDRMLGAAAAARRARYAPAHCRRRRRHSVTCQARRSDVHGRRKLSRGTRQLQRGGRAIERSPRAGRSTCDLQRVLAELGRLECNDVWSRPAPDWPAHCCSCGLVDELDLLYRADRCSAIRARAMVVAAGARVASTGRRYDYTLRRHRARIGADVTLTCAASRVAALTRATVHGQQSCMFTGIVQAIGRGPRAHEPRGGDVELRDRRAALDRDGVAIGDSIAVSGVLPDGDAPHGRVRSRPMFDSRRCA